MAAKFTPEQIRQIQEWISKAFEEAFTEEEAATLGHPNKIKCAICKVGLYTTGGAIIAAALASGLALDEDAELVEYLAEFAHVSEELIKEWLQEEKFDSVKKLVHFICKKMHACS